MRIIYWMETCLPHTVGGREVLTAHMMRSLAERGHQFSVVTLAQGDESSNPVRVDALGGVPVYGFNFYRWIADRDIEAQAHYRRRMAELVDELDADLIHFHDVGSSSLFAPRGVPWMLTQHFMPHQPTPLQSNLIRRGLRRMDWVVSVSRAAQDWVVQAEPSVRDRCSVVYNGLESPPIDPAPLPWDPPSLICVGRLVPLKGFELAIDAFARLLPRFPDLTLTIVGAGEQEEPLRRRAADVGVVDAVRWTGLVEPDRVWEWINRATVMLVPSRPSGTYSEGLPLVALQGMLMARPVVGSRCAGIAEAVEDETTGLLVDIGDVDGLVEATGRLLSDRAAAEAMGRAALCRAREHFAWDKGLVDGYNALYHQVVERHNPNR